MLALSVALVLTGKSSGELVEPSIVVVIAAYACNEVNKNIQAQARISMFMVAPP
jgi:hypothetical protein